MVTRNGLIATAVAAVMGLSLALGVPAFAHEDDVDGGHVIPHQVGALALDGGVTWFVQGTSGNGTNDSTDLTYTMDLNLTRPMGDSGTINISLEAGNGAGVDGRLGSLSTANYDAFITEIATADNAFNSPSVSQLYYEGDYADGRLVVDFGKLDVHSMYDDNAYANDETDQFMSAIFTRSAGTTYAELDQYYGPGLAITAGLTESASLMALVANGNGSGFDGVSDRPYSAAQLTFSPEVGGLEGNYRVYGIYDARAYLDSGGNTTENVAWGVSLDQALPGGVGVFARYSAQDDGIVSTAATATAAGDDANVVDASWSAGGVVGGAAWGRAADVLGIGYGLVGVNTRHPSMAGKDDEGHLEAYYKLAVSDHFTVTPDVQVITNNGGDPNADTVTVLGVRGQMNF